MSKFSSDERATPEHRLIEGLDESMSLISQILRSSHEMCEQFKAQRDAVLSSYQMDIGRIDEEYERISTEQKLRKGTNHGLNFHIASKSESSAKDGSNVFIHENFELTALSDNNPETGGGVVKGNKSVASIMSQSRSFKTNNDEQVRFNSRSSLLTKMETFRIEEARLLKKLADAQPKDDGMTTTLMARERRDLEDELESCRSRQAQDIVAMVNVYNPMLKKVDEQASCVTYLQPIEHILEKVKAEATEACSIRSRGRKGERAESVPTELNSVRQNIKTKQKSKRKPSANNRHRLLLDSTNAKETEHSVLHDSDNFLTLHELAIQNPLSHFNLHSYHDGACSRSGSGASYHYDVAFDDEPEPPRQSLCSLVKCNTRPLNPLELGRRNRVDNIRHATAN